MYRWRVCSRGVFLAKNDCCYDGMQCRSLETIHSALESMGRRVVRSSAGSSVTTGGWRERGLLFRRYDYKKGHAERLAEARRWNKTRPEAGSVVYCGRKSWRSADRWHSRASRVEFVKWVCVYALGMVGRNVWRDILEASSQHKLSSQCVEQEASHTTLV